MAEIPILILAAGSSSRLGRPKQLLVRDQISFLQFSIQEANKSSDRVVVVLGSEQEIIRKSFEFGASKGIMNSEWEEGMASSIRCGLAYILSEDPQTKALLIMVCDQPFADAAVLNQLIEAYNRGQYPIIASGYRDIVGTPVLFDQVFFKDLLQLKGASGAKKIVVENLEKVLSIPFPLGYLDIDTQEDFLAFQELYRNKDLIKN